MNSHLFFQKLHHHYRALQFWKPVPNFLRTVFHAGQKSSVTYLKSSNILLLIHHHTGKEAGNTACLCCFSVSTQWGHQIYCHIVPLKERKKHIYKNTEIQFLCILMYHFHTVVSIYSGPCCTKVNTSQGKINRFPKKWKWNAYRFPPKEMSFYFISCKLNQKPSNYNHGKHWSAGSDQQGIVQPQHLLSSTVKSLVY